MAAKRVLIDSPTLEAKLREAAAEHHKYESSLDAIDDDWPAWYTRFIVDSLPYNSSIQPAPNSLIDMQAIEAQAKS